MDVIDGILEKWIDSRKINDEILKNSIDYIIKAPSKHIRSKLSVILAEDLGLKTHDPKLSAVVVSTELIHSASLIIDDLPEMDNAGLRRGKKAHHLVFGGACTILTAVDMIGFAFAEAVQVPGLAAELGCALDDLVSGQFGDLRGMDKDLDSALNIHEKKQARYLLML